MPKILMERLSQRYPRPHGPRISYGVAWPYPQDDSLPHELHWHTLGEQASLVGSIQKQLDRLPPAWPVVHGPLVHVHAHEGVGPFITDTPVELFRMREGGTPMLQ